MIQKTLQAGLELWEAWIEFDPVADENFGNIYIVGELLTSQKEKPVVFRCAHAMAPCQLVLQIITNESDHRRKNSEIVYSLPVKNPGEFRSVLICHNENVIAEIRDIDVLI